MSPDKEVIVSPEAKVSEVEAEVIYVTSEHGINEEDIIANDRPYEDQQEFNLDSLSVDMEKLKSLERLQSLENIKKQSDIDTQPNDIDQDELHADEE